LISAEQISAELQALEGKIFCEKHGQGSIASYWQRTFPDISPAQFYSSLKALQIPGDSPKINIEFTNTLGDYMPLIEIEWPSAENPRDRMAFMKFEPKQNELYFSNLIAPHISDQSYAKKLMYWLSDLTTKLDKKKITACAMLQMGAYTWARFGFTPYADHWLDLKEDIRNYRLNKNFDRISFDKRMSDGKGLWDDSPYIDAHPAGFELTKDETAEIKDALSSKNPEDIWALSDLGRELARTSDKPPHIITVGKILLSGLSWEGSLSLKPGTKAMDRFTSYINRAPEQSTNKAVEI